MLGIATTTGILATVSQSALVENYLRWLAKWPVESGRGLLRGILQVCRGIVFALKRVDDLDDEALDALARFTVGVDFDTSAKEMYQPPPASSALQTKVSWKNYTEASSRGECVRRWWGRLTQEWAELRDRAYLPFCGPGREEVVDDCLARLQDLNKGMLRGRNNCFVVGPKDIGKTCLLKALVCELGVE